MIAATEFDDLCISIDLTVEEMRALADDPVAALRRYREMPGDPE